MCCRSYNAISVPEYGLLITRNAHICCLSKDTLIKVLEYCKNKEIISLGECSKSLLNYSRSSWIWLRRCMQKWHFSLEREVSQSMKLEYTFLQRLIEEFPTQINNMSASDEFVFASKEVDNSRRMLKVIFKGTPGQGNRSVQANNPFPVTQRRAHILPWGLEALFPFLKLCERPEVEKLHWKGLRMPFSFPTKICTAEGKGQSSIDVSPRLVAYYEITIGTPSASRGLGDQEQRGRMLSEEVGEQQQAQQTQEEEEEEAPRAQDNAEGRQDEVDCVAIGLADEHFCCEEAFPGWVRHSFGYHGDDGCIYHGSGIMPHRFGPRFGTGDVVGCGIDYSQEHDGAEIFFTLNGKYLGHAFKNVKPLKLFPTVGVDSQSPISFNFGEDVFVFDLQDYCTRQKEIISHRIPEFAKHKKAYNKMSG
mmetsp:Transcript_15950/g.21090  ORF Transcript_15950/g.21090 Transcript_15950/m.21090 type:complete len:420 (-) Transcript_15950:287-1546(-)